MFSFGYVLVTTFFAVTVLIFCWGLSTYLYHAIGCISEKQLNKLRFKNKVVFTLARVWKGMSELRKYPQDAIKGESGDAINIQEFREKRKGNQRTIRRNIE